MSSGSPILKSTYQYYREAKGLLHDWLRLVLNLCLLLRLLQSSLSTKFKYLTNQFEVRFFQPRDGVPARPRFTFETSNMMI